MRDQAHSANSTSNRGHAASFSKGDAPSYVMDSRPAFTSHGGYIDK